MRLSKSHTKIGLPTEEAEQIAFVRWASYQPYFKYLIAIENGGSRSGKIINGKRVSFEGSRLKKKGVKKGVSDLFLALPKNGKHGMWIEMKTQDGGARSKEQKEFMELMVSAGYEAQFCNGWNDAMMKVCQYLGVTYDCPMRSTSTMALVSTFTGL